MTKPISWLDIQPLFELAKSKKEVKPNMELEPIAPAFAPKSQKAKGIAALQDWLWMFGYDFDVKTPGFTIVSNDQLRLLMGPEPTVAEAFPTFSASNWQENREIIYAKTTYVRAPSSFYVFARGCPVRPRHGFTDSKSISIVTRERFFSELSELVGRMLQDDPEAELVFMPVIEADFNMVVNANSVVIGSGHDGATAGRDTMCFPSAGSMLDRKHRAINKKNKDEIGISADEDVFIEIVGQHRKGKGRKINDFYSSGALLLPSLYMVQLRGGPKVTASANYLPRDVKIDSAFQIPPEVLGQDGNMRPYRDTEWERVIADVKAKPNWERFYVLHPNGALSSHFGIHCYLNQIPYITDSPKPRNGSIVKAEAQTRKAGSDEKAAFLAGVKIGLARTIEIESKLALMILLAELHNFTALDQGSSDQVGCFGIACGITLRLSMTAILGELRYGLRMEQNYTSPAAKNKLAREAVFYDSLAFPFDYVLQEAYRKTPRFGMRGWRDNHEIGGLAWLRCGIEAFGFWNAVAEYAFGSDSSSLDQVASELNVVVNICHNTARMLTKFQEGGNLFDYVPTNPQAALIVAAPALSELWRGRKEDEGKTEAETVTFRTLDLSGPEWYIEEGKGEEELCAICDVELECDSWCHCDGCHDYGQEEFCHNCERPFGGEDDEDDEAYCQC